MLYDLQKHRTQTHTHTHMTHNIHGRTEQIQHKTHPPNAALTVHALQTGKVLTMKATLHNLYTGSEDGFVRRWSIKNGTCWAVLRGESLRLTCANTDRDTDTDSDSNTDITRNRCTHTTQRPHSAPSAGHKDRIHSLLSANASSLLSGSADTNTVFWDILRHDDVRILLLSFALCAARTYPPTPHTHTLFAHLHAYPPTYAYPSRHTHTALIAHPSLRRFRQTWTRRRSGL